MTSSELKRRYLIVRLAEAFLPLALFVSGLVVMARNPPLGLLIFGVGFASRFVLSFLTGRLAVQRAHETYVDEGGSRWWYQRRTRQVAQAELSPGPQFDGPYASRADAERAPEIARERAAAWNAEDD